MVWSFQLLQCLLVTLSLFPYWLSFCFWNMPLSSSTWSFAHTQILSWVGLFHWTHLIIYLLLLLWVAAKDWCILDISQIFQTRPFFSAKLSNIIMSPAPLCPILCRKLLTLSFYKSCNRLSNISLKYMSKWLPKFVFIWLFNSNKVIIPVRIGTLFTFSFLVWNTL